MFIAAFTSWSGLQGFLRWNYAVWNDDPRADIRYGDFLAGDTNFVYPRPNGAPLLSLRYKAMRKAIWLYELLEMVREKSGDDAANSLIFGVLRNTETEKYYTDGHYRDNVLSTDYADYAAMLKGALEQL